MSRSQITFFVALAVVFGLRIGSAPSSTLVGVAIQQGISTADIGGKHLFIDRQGEQFTVFDAASGYKGARVRWCPYEELFWAPTSADIFDRNGQHARGPSPNNMIRYAGTLSRIDGLFRVDLSARRIGPARGGQVTDDILGFFDRYLNQNNIPGSKRLIFCPNPVT